MTGLKGKTAIITGASRSKGIGAAICRSLAEAGADIFFTHWSPFDEEAGNGEEPHFPESFKKELQSLGVRAAHMQADLSKEETPKLIIDKAEEILGTPSILINNATYEFHADFRTLNREILDKHYKVNNSGTILLSVEFAKRFEAAFPESKDGRIIHIVSKGPDPNNLAYIATKGMLIGITEPLSVALAPVGITVNAIDPGPTDSGWMNEEIKNQLLPLFPAGRLGVPDDAAKLIRFLVSSDGGWITGQTIKSEGGFIGK
ncbi:SDR family oxidoreductase [Rossellomorea vietnamensis]|uniref:SDR family oxidoreductase n=1 Tax=Rossellomorea vietnamensis TaxID=218284 RepID=A0A5D4NIY9_9BACI|nr:SDR family oxidoreductase [Rossellomorea vietnamensis]TYS13789.1 SDR family oxidoreductase [Rossellomorea vietnamensis]